MRCLLVKQGNFRLAVKRPERWALPISMSALVIWLSSTGIQQGLSVSRPLGRSIACPFPLLCRFYAMQMPRSYIDKRRIFVLDFFCFTTE